VAILTFAFLHATSTLAPPVCAAEPLHDVPAAAKEVKIAVSIDDHLLTATLADNSAAHDFAVQLPLDLTMDDLFGREKFAHIPESVNQGVQRTWNYRVGDIAYWSPRQDIAIFYRQDGETIPPPGLIPIGRIDGGFEAFNVRGPVHVHIALIQ
jgi:hypothetical protein